MKKTLITTIKTALLAAVLMSAPAYAESLPLVPPAQESEATTEKSPADILATQKLKIEAELRDTVLKLKAVIDRTQVLIDLLTKNNKETSKAQDTLVSARVSLDEATAAIDQFAGVSVALEETKTTDTKLTPTIELKTKKSIPFKDPLKKAQDSLNDSKALLIQSISVLKESLIPKEQTR